MPSARFKQLPKVLLAPLPLPLLQPLLNRIVRTTSQRRPEIFLRLGVHARKNFLIDPINLPFVFLLQPNPDAPRMRVYRSKAGLTYHASISGSFFDLLKLIDGRMDGDAIFFSRALRIEGDTEAIVCLRNALDDVDGSIAEDVAGFLGHTGKILLNIIRRITAHERYS